MLIFQLTSHRYGPASTVLTSNKGSRSGARSAAGRKHASTIGYTASESLQPFRVLVHLSWFCPDVLALG
jgi:hypothetical protein